MTEEMIMYESYVEHKDIFIAAQRWLRWFVPTWNYKTRHTNNEIFFKIITASKLDVPTIIKNQNKLMQKAVTEW